jgi:hypothetical protein
VVPNLQLKDRGGLGIKNHDKMTICLLCKWWWKLENNVGIWQDIIHANYVHNKPISFAQHIQTDSMLGRSFES